MKKFTAELIGTFILVFVGTGAVVFGNGTEGLGHLGIALAFGLSIVAAAYSIGTISGAHLNPAVSVAMFVNKRMDAKELVNYIVAQVIGAIIASAAIFFLSGGADSGLGSNAYTEVSTAGAFIFELITSFIFILVIVTVTSATKGNGKIAGLVIGLTLTAMILVGLNITGLSVNPARSLAPALFVGGKALAQLWVFIVAPIVGGILAALVGKNLLDTEA
ncbi:MIP/aquaporin family protein [Streptococcus pluranimalium]|uniref:Aquaporin n=1 Tax=Streptococcus pluranimalium TaxID=82348 RepID=A0A2L0D5T0_9STRE|nr:aquaporin [Streptococcus pluranimalium]AUW97188.1 aquaporin [Streptococcus pluranimalium]